jgi:hypothetical protein
MTPRNEGTAVRNARAIAAHMAMILAAAFAGTLAHAARPMITDDARTVDAKAGPVESWVRFNRDSREYWALPACNFTGNLELTFGGARTDDDGPMRTTDVLLQGKTLFRTLEPNSWSIGMAAGMVRHPDRDSSRNAFGEAYAYVPMSFSFRDDRIVLHTNLGALHEREAKRTRVTWGLGSETQLHERVYLIAETYGQNQGRPFFQIGVRYWIVLNRMQVDTTYGNRFGSDSNERWISVGLRLLSVPFLP